MSDINVDAAKQLAETSQRISVQIAGQPKELREEAFAVADRNMREAARQLGLSGEIELLMKRMRQFVLDIDVGGEPQGGNA